MRRMPIVAAAGFLSAVILARSGARAEDAKPVPPPERGSIYRKDVTPPMYKPDYHKNGGRCLSRMGSAFLAAVLALSASGCGVLDPAYWRGVDNLQRIERNRSEGVKYYYPPGEMERREEDFHNDMGILRALREKHGLSGDMILIDPLTLPLWRG